MFIIYQSTDDLWITTKRKESKFLEEYFSDGERNIDDYVRTEINDVGVCVDTSVNVDAY